MWATSHCMWATSSLNNKDQSKAIWKDFWNLIPEKVILALGPIVLNRRGANYVLLKKDQSIWSKIQEVYNPEITNLEKGR